MRDSRATSFQRLTGNRSSWDPRLPTPLLFKILAVAVIAYLSFGKAFAYLGLYPVFIGEIMLAAALAVQARSIRTNFFWTTSGGLAALLLLIIAAQVSVSLVWEETAMTEILRNTAFAYYALFALVAFSLASPDRITACIRFLNTAFIRGAPLILTTITASMVAYVYFSRDLPLFPGTEVQILYYKATDASVVLCILIYLWRRGHLAAFWGAWALALALIAGARSRSALICLLFTFAFKLQINRRSLSVLAVLVLAVAGLWLTDTAIDLGGYRTVSVQQFASNLSSLAFRADNADPSTIQNSLWRTRWWRAILEDCIESGRMFTGRGWGSNLANDFSVQSGAADSVNSLRNPHNILLGVLGRGGMLAALAWCALYISLLLTAFAAANTKDQETAETTSICILALVLGLINGLTDVFLESPQNAIPHWFFIGLLLSLAHSPQQTVQRKPGGIRSSQQLPGHWPAVNSADPFVRLG